MFNFMYFGIHQFMYKLYLDRKDVVQSFKFHHKFVFFLKNASFILKFNWDLNIN